MEETWGGVVEERRKGHLDLTNQVSALCTKVDKLCDHADKMDDIIFGKEGVPGHEERIRIMEHFIVELRSFHGSIKKYILGSASAIVTAIIISMVVK